MRQADPNLTVSRLDERHEAALGQFFTAIVANNDHQTFHPHAFDAKVASTICLHHGHDLYCAALHGEEMLAYGMLRGWDAGYETPSLGIAVHPAHRGLQVGRMMMDYLHIVARLRGAPQIRLKVYKDNVKALRLYKGLGYVFEDALSGSELVGILPLKR